jgi:hypothetical protein
MPNNRQPVLKVDFSPQKGRMKLSIMKGTGNLASLEVDTKSASSIAAVILEGAKQAAEKVGRGPERSEDAVVRYSNVIPSAINLGPSHIQGCTSLIFHFGETTLGVSVPDQELHEYGQRLMALGATGAAN